MELARLCQAFFVLASAGILAVAVTPASARRLLTQYGARSAAATAPKESEAAPESDMFTKLIAWVTSTGKVPHWWFMHFYVLSVSSSLFWAVQYLRHGAVLQAIVQYQADRSTTTTTLNQVILAWFMMALQGTRRLYECLFVMRASSSEMWIVHWLLGCAYYLIINVAVWIEGSRESDLQGGLAVLGS
jgi:3-oxo-5-alpha-steroid 4-dehydrogenase 3 / polyprenol reductase